MKNWNIKQTEKKTIWSYVKKKNKFGRETTFKTYGDLDLKIYDEYDQVIKILF